MKLVFDMNTESDCLIAAMEWTRELAQAILARHTVVEGLCEEDASIKALTYLGDIELHELHPDFHNHLEELGFEGSWHLLDTPVPLGERIRLSDVSLVISKYGYFYWDIIPKHWNESIETVGISISHNLGMFDDRSFDAVPQEETT